MENNVTGKAFHSSIDAGLTKEEAAAIYKYLGYLLNE
jgi:hypothetical protein